MKSLSGPDVGEPTSSRKNQGFFALLGLTLLLLVGRAAPVQAACTGNPIVCENQLAGTPASTWDISGAGDPSIQGFATDISVNKGGTIHFKIKTPARAYTITIYRMGYYQGNGARQVATVTPSASLPQSQPACIMDGSSGDVDCGNWAQSASWTVPTTAVSGIYFAKLVRTDTRGSSHIVFLVRDDASTADLLFQTSDMTWQAYNDFADGNGQVSLYLGGPGTNPSRAYKVSYNRPFNDRQSYAVHDWVFYSEYPMVRWLERNGYNVVYQAGIDTDRGGVGPLLQHRVFLSVGHDEYWSGQQRANVEAALAAGMNLAFFSGNEMFWKTRWEPSIDGTFTNYRTLVCYKETHASAVIDPLDPPTWTGTWRDPRFSPPADGGRPENALTGQLFTVNDPGAPTDSLPIQVPQAFSSLPFWRNTAVANLAPGQTATLSNLVLGYEWDTAPTDASTPPGLIRMSSSTYNVPSVILDYGHTFGPGTATHSLTLYRAPSGAMVFGAGTVQWSFGLDSTHDVTANNGGPSVVDPSMQQATVNLFADMGVQPATLQAGLVLTSSSPSAPPTSVITSPASGTTIGLGSTVIISGTASPSAGGAVASVQVSTDGGQTWQAASGSTNWSFAWTPATTGVATVQSRATDISGSLETPSAGIQITVSASASPCPCSIWSPSTAPAFADAADPNAVELGVKFQVSTAGSITGIRFYKGSTNTGTHVGNLWTSAGTLLASATFTGETASGWQQVSFAAPVAIAANTTYVASYHTNVGQYADDPSYFAAGAVVNGPLTALASASSPNGVYVYSASSAFPSQTFQSSNYWVDVVFAGSSTAPPPPPRPTANGATIWPATAVPAIADSPDPNAVELGVKFTADVAGTITGIRFYKGTGNTGTHIGNLWTSTGTLLATATFAGETASGWQQVTFATPVTIAANTVYVASYYAPNGNYAVDQPYFAAGPVNNPPLHALQDGASGGNGVYVYGAKSAFPGQTFNSSNYWVDVVFVAGSAPPPPPGPTPSGATIWPTTTVPATSDAADPNAVELGVKFTADVAGTITGIRFYKGTGNTGTHIGNLWTSTGTLLATATFAGETASGWQQVTFATPVTIAANTVYVASYYAPNGNYAVDQPYFAAGPVNNPPLHALQDGASGGNGVYVYGAKSAFPGQTFNSSNYWVDVVFVAGSAPATTTSTVWPTTTVPATSDAADPNAVELGVKFTADVAGTITGIRFYKGTGNTGTHIGNLWTSTGTLLATATFAGETASGWQQVTFATPVTIAANTVYVASYYAPNGNYAVDSAYFAAAPVNAPPLHALQDGASGGNGVYVYGAKSAFPSQTFNSDNYWVDVVFVH